jgi:hypothetical protein
LPSNCEGSFDSKKLLELEPLPLELELPPVPQLGTSVPRIEQYDFGIRLQVSPILQKTLSSSPLAELELPPVPQLSTSVPLAAEHISSGSEKQTSSLTWQKINLEQLGTSVPLKAEHTCAGTSMQVSPVRQKTSPADELEPELEPPGSGNFLSGESGNERSEEQEMINAAASAKAAIKDKKQGKSFFMDLSPLENESQSSGNGEKPRANAINISV